MNDDIEFDVIVNGQKANAEIKKIENSQNNLEKTVKKTNESIGSSWASVGVKVAAASASFALLTQRGAQTQKSMFGLSATTKDYIKQASELYAMNQTIIAGFVQTGKSAGISGEQIANMIDMAVALSRKYPHESVETFIDNLSMLNKTGEAQGYIVDILEQKLGAVDLKAISLADKMSILQEATQGVNQEFDKTSGAKLDKSLQDAENQIDTLGTSLLSLIDSSGGLFLFNKAVLFTSTGLQGLANIASLVKIGFKQMFGQDTSEDIKAFNEQLQESVNTWNKFLGKVQDSQSTVGITVRPDFMGTTKPKEQKQIEEEAKAISNTNKLASITSLSSWTRFYEKIGDYQTSWAIKEAQLRQEYVDATEDQFQKMSEIAKKEYFEKIQEDSEETTDNIKDALDSAFGSGLADMLLTGKASFKDFANSIIMDIGRIIIKKQLAGIVGNISDSISGGIGDFIGDLFAKGGVPTTRMAQGGIVNSPTKMRFAQGGMGLVGERNKAEGVLPLTRTANGDLGVTAKLGNSGSQITSDVQITINAIDTQTGVTFLLQNKDTIQAFIADSLKTNGTIRANL